MNAINALLVVSGPATFLHRQRSGKNPSGRHWHVSILFSLPESRQNQWKCKSCD